MKDKILVIDNGGTNIKSVLFDTKGEEYGHASVKTPMIELPGQKREVDLDILWDAVLESINLVIERAGIDTAEILCIANIGHGKGLYLLDEDGNNLRNEYCQLIIGLGILLRCGEKRV